jgi:hypothetical protein
MEKQELTSDSTVIAGPLLAHVFLSFPQVKKNNSTKICRRTKKKMIYLQKVEKENKFMLK